MAGAGRVIPLNQRARAVLEMWSANFPNRQPEHYVFPSEQYHERGVVTDTDPTRPIGTWKEGWEHAKERAGVTCRFHDLRHTCATRMLEGGVPFAVVASLMGWSASMAIKMGTRYGHIGQQAYRQALKHLDLVSLVGVCQLRQGFPQDSGLSIDQTVKSAGVAKTQVVEKAWWALQDSNLRPRACEARALTN